MKPPPRKWVEYGCLEERGGGGGGLENLRKVLSSKNKSPYFTYGNVKRNRQKIVNYSDER